MEKSLDEMIVEREEMRAEEKQLTAEIKAERQRLLDESKKMVEKSNISSESYQSLRSENARLRELLALLKRADGSTYKAVGEMLGVSAGRAKQLIDKHMRILRYHSHELGEDS